MKRLFIMLLIACSAFTTVSADSAATPQKKAKSVVKDLEGIIAFYAKEGSETTAQMSLCRISICTCSQAVQNYST